MTEPKTLKDIKPVLWKELGSDRTAILIPIKDLRHEAIKWYKDYVKNTQRILSDENLNWKKELKSITPEQASELIQHQGVTWFIKHFFGITQEELK